MVPLVKRLYTFLGVHSFLIGLFPFYIPVYLYTSGSTLAGICFFIAVTGFGFCVSLYLWDRIAKVIPFRYLIVISFLSEFVLLTLFFLDNNLIFLILAGFFNGVFNCNFWIIQRLLFLDTITPGNSGEKFGNFQIFVMIVLKLAIFIGGVLLEATGFLTLYLLSAVMVLLASIYFLRKGIALSLGSEFLRAKPLSVKQVMGYRDLYNSRPIFAIDGVFLYLESYFWIISLFLIVHQSFLKLGLLVIFLTLLFGIIFVVIKNSIDKLPLNTMYTVAVVLYCFSWILRGVLSFKMDHFSLLLILALITFCTSFFRLVFNKRFFDLAKNTSSHQYVFIKSYFSQLFLALFFGVLGIFMLGQNGEVVQHLSKVYFLAAFCSLLYFVYRRPGKNEDSQIGL